MITKRHPEPARVAPPAFTGERIACTAYGVCVGVRTNATGLRPRIEALFPPGSEAADFDDAEVCFTLWTDPGRGAGGLWRDDRLLIQHGDPALLLALLEDFVRAEVAYYADDEWLFVHAGVVAKHGRAVVMPGHSHAGKTHLVRALMDRGAEYLSDDMAVFDRDGRVHAYPAPLGLRTGHPVRKDLQPVPAERVAGNPARPAIVLFTHFRANVRAWHPRPVSAAHALMSLSAHSLAARRMPRQVMAALGSALASAETLQAPRGEAGPVADWILARLGST